MERTRGLPVPTRPGSAGRSVPASRVERLADRPVVGRLAASIGARQRGRARRPWPARPGPRGSRCRRRPRARRPHRRARQLLIPSTSWTIRWTWLLVGGAVAGDRALHLVRRRLRTGRPCWAAARSTTPRACPTAIAVWAFLREEEPLDGDDGGLVELDQVVEERVDRQQPLRQRQVRADVSRQP